MEKLSGDSEDLGRASNVRLRQRMELVRRRPLLPPNSQLT
jgi:hypothetical protein